MIYVKNATVCTPYEIIKGFGILIEDKRIKRLVSERSPAKLPPNTKVLDAKDKIVFPGFIDVHTQGAGGSDFLDGTKKALKTISKTLARFGTTSFLATTVFKNGRNDHIKAITDYRLPVTDYPGGARLLGIHLEGPFINIKKKGMIRPNGISGCSNANFEKILKATKGKLRMMTIAPELKGAIEIIKGLKNKGIVASFGHSDAGYEETVRGINTGITHATHIFNAMRPLHHRDPGSLAALLMDDRVSVQLISDGVHVHPAIIRLLIKLKGIKNIVLITDSMSSQGISDGKYVYDGWEYESKNGTARYKDGTLIGTSLPMSRMVKRMMHFGGVSLAEAIQTATVNPARILGIAHKKGSIEEGKDADLVIMDKRFNVFATVVEGRLVYKNDVVF